MDPLIADAAIDYELVASVGGTVAPGATDGSIMIEPDTSGKPIDDIDIASPVEVPEEMVGP